MSSIPTSMKAATISGYGPILETVKVISVPVPQPKEDEVLIRVHFASINPIDNLIVLGQLQAMLPVQFPYIIGYDVSGVVAAVGLKVSKFKVGEEVFSRVQQGHGTLAEYVAESEKLVALKPSNLSHAQAAALPLVALTSLQALEKLKLQKGQKILITCGSGGVGIHAVQIANNVYGAFVAATASKSKHDAIAPLLKGQFQLIDYKTEDFTKKLSDFDAVFDISAEVQKEFPIVKRGGRIVSIAQAPPTPEAVKEWGLPESVVQMLTNANAPILRSAEEHGVSYEYHFMHPSAEGLDQIAKWTQDKKLTVVIDKTYSLDNAAQALAHLKEGKSTGKVVIQVI